MAKNVQSLSGPAKDAYVERAVSAVPGIAPSDAKRVAERLKGELTRVWVRVEALAEDTASGSQSNDAAEAAPDPATPADDFDPFTPNVVVVIRTAGRDKAFAALSGIATPDRLRLLAREQQLGIDPELATSDDIRAAIITAAERRIANRRSAAS